jgi:hypothetical protein
MTSSERQQRFLAKLVSDRDAIINELRARVAALEAILPGTGARLPDPVPDPRP